MLILSIVMIPLAVFVCIGFVCSIGILAVTPSTYDQQGGQSENHGETACPVELIRLH